MSLFKWVAIVLAEMLYEGYSVLMRCQKAHGHVVYIEWRLQWAQ